MKKNIFGVIAILLLILLSGHQTKSAYAAIPGCTTDTSGYSSVDGRPCAGTPPSTSASASSQSTIATYPSGCSSNSGFSATNGNACNGSTSVTVQRTPLPPIYTCSANGLSSATGFKCGCFSLNGFSSINGQSCSVQPGPIVIQNAVCTNGFDSSTGFKCGCASLSGYSSTNGNSCALEINNTSPVNFTSSPVTINASVNFTRDLKLGSTGEDVRSLQKFLNSKGYTIANSGAGSPGNESSYFGSLTLSALARFQQANGISPASGYFGRLTRAKVSSM